MISTSTTDSTERTKKVSVRKSVKWWIKQIEAAETEARRFREQARDAYNEYLFAGSYQRNYRFNRADTQHLSVFYSSKRTLIPALYSSQPIPIVKRRFDDTDDVSRVGSEILERLGQYLMEEGDFNHFMRRAAQDYAITSLGSGRVYVKSQQPRMIRQYIPDDEPLPESTQFQTDENGRRYLEKPDPLDPTEVIIPKWQPWDSVIHTPAARDWCDVWWKGYVNFYDKHTFLEKFDSDGSKKLRAMSPFRYNQRRDDKNGQDEYYRKDDEQTEGDFAKVVEIFNERDKQVLWICPDIGEMFLDEREDIYKLRKFYPSPRPMQELSGDQTLYPTPEYVQTRSILTTIDYLMDRMWRLTKALKPHGVYDSSQKELQRLINETEDADLVPVQNMAKMFDKSGFDIPIVYADKTALASSLLQTYDALERQKELYYEITGQSDLMRGVVAAAESATATASKDKYIGIRLSEHKQNIENFARDMLEIMLDLSLEIFDDQTILMVVSADQFTDDDKELIPQALELVRNDKLRTFRINIETDSTVALNSENEKQVRIELLEAVSMYMEKLMQVMTTMPEFAPMLMDIILHTIRGMGQSTDVESTIESTFQNIREMLKAEEEAPEEEEPEDPTVMLEQLKAQVEMEKVNLEREKMGFESTKMQIEQQKLQSDVAVEQIESAAEHEKAIAQIESARMKFQAEQLKAQVEHEQTQVKLLEAQLSQVEQQPNAIPSPAPVKQEPMNINITMANQKRVGQFVDTPEGRKFVSEVVEE